MPVKRSRSANPSCATIYRKNSTLANAVMARNALRKTSLRWIKNYGLRSKISSFQ
jgi:hypothetical protein